MSYVGVVEWVMMSYVGVVEWVVMSYVGVVEWVMSYVGVVEWVMSYVGVVEWVMSYVGVVEGSVYWVGLVTVAWWLVYVMCELVAGLRKFVYARLVSPHQDLARKYGGKWAVVTGCTDGLGKEFARQLAKRGCNLLLISRTLQKLHNVQRQIESECPDIETEVIQVDFTHGREVYTNITSHLQGKHIAILVNNVGLNIYPPKKFPAVSEEEIWDLGGDTQNHLRHHKP
ncbi:hypothetical protein Pmani_028741 [Petrolisthes manimaculis]|uniref:Uncharacterized protein n=1 Tax=Petrolisthes manimaculis TaxID=1843537 RepID=A0AAE1TVC0_9EUCA|nr:hypothetical protein Pmani_028741 [Petrolisthes manimaculis]